MTVFNRQKTGPHAQSLGKVTAMRDMTAQIEWQDGNLSTEDVRSLLGLLETKPEQMWQRVARVIASVETTAGREEWEPKFRAILRDFKYVPGGRILAGAGVEANLTYANCFVIPSPRDSRGGIVDTLKAQAEIMARGGGVGFDLSTLRPQGAAVRGVNGTSSGPVDFANLYSIMTGIIEQAGSRRGAEMVTLHDWHPDLLRFISAKSEDEHFINHANLSVLVSDRLMQAVHDDAAWVFMFPDTDAPGYNERWDGDLDAWIASGGPVIEYDHMPARKVWRSIAEYAHRRGEPGVIFINTIHRESTTNANFRGQRKEVSTNPCGEQPLSANSICNLGALNLAAFVRNGQVDFKALAETAAVAIRFQDDVIDAGYYPLPEIEEWAKKERRIGLGIMGLADMLIMLGVRYGSEKARRITESVFRTIRDAAYSASCNLALEKEPFPAFDRNGYMKAGFVARLPAEIQKRIYEGGIRNITLLTVAPTGTTSLLAGVSSGIEPVFRFRTLRKDALGEHVILHPLAEAWQAEHPDEPLPDYFVSADQLTPEEHVVMQAVAQAFIDASISKCVTGDTLITTSRGVLPIAAISTFRENDTFVELDGLRVWNGHAWVEAKSFYYGGERETRKMTLDYGLSIEGTPNHRVKIFDPIQGEIVWMRLDEIKAGDYLAIAVGTGPLDTYPRELIQIYGAPPSSILNNSPHSVPKEITLPERITKPFARWLGYWIAEGNVTENSVVFTNNDPAILSDYVELTKEVFGVDCLMTRDNRREHLFSAKIHRRSLVRFLLDYLGCGHNATTKQVPKAVMAAGPNIVEQFLKGITLDGNLANHHHDVVVMNTMSPELARGVQALLLRLGMLASIDRKQVVYPYVDGRTRSTSFSVRLAGKHARDFVRRIGFAETRKNKRYSYSVAGARDPIPVPTNAVAELVEMKTRTAKAETLTVSLRHYVSRLRTGRSKTLRRESVEYILDVTAELSEINAHQQLKALLPYAYAQVRDVEIRHAEVFDLFVPNGNAFVGNGLINHNTINGPNSQTVEDVERLFTYAYESGCKGVTYFRDGSVNEVVLKEAPAVATPAAASQENESFVELLDRPERMLGRAYRVKTHFGTLTLDVHEVEPNVPFEVFVNVGAAGSDLLADAVALGRLASTMLRMDSRIAPARRLDIIIDKLQNIGGSGSYGFGPQRITSLASAIARGLQMYLNDIRRSDDESDLPEPPPQHEHEADLCPSCGAYSLVKEEGCAKCYTCGFSQC